MKAEKNPLASKPIYHDGAGFLIKCAQARSELKNGGRIQEPQAMAYCPPLKLPGSWGWASVSEVCERVSVGHVGPTTEHFTTELDGVPLVRSQNVRPGYLDVASALKITTTFHRKLRKSQLAAGDVLIVRVGANRGDVAKVKRGLGALNCANIVFARPLIPGFIE